MSRTATREDEFTAFVTANYPRLLHLAELTTGDRGLGEDLLQATLTKTYLRWATVRQKSPFGYVRTALVNARTDWWRRLSSRERPTAEFAESTSGFDLSGQVVGREVVLRALAQLTRRERAVVVLRFYEDLSEADTASVLGIAVGTVKSASARALAKLRVSPELVQSPEPAVSVAGLAVPDRMRTS